MSWDTVTNPEMPFYLVETSLFRTTVLARYPDEAAERAIVEDMRARNTVNFPDFQSLSKEEEYVHVYSCWRKYVVDVWPHTLLKHKSQARINDIIAKCDDQKTTVLPLALDEFAHHVQLSVEEFRSNALRRSKKKPKIIR